MENKGDGYGILPDEITAMILQLLNLKSAASLSITSKYWYNRYKHILNHATIVMTCIESSNKCYKFPNVVTIKNGKLVLYGLGYFLRDGHRSQNLTKISHFATVGEMQQFIKQFNNILSNYGTDGDVPTSTADPQLDRFWMRIQTPSETQYYGTSDNNNMTKISYSTAEKLYSLIDDLKLHEHPRDSCSKITVKIFERNPDYRRDTLYSHTITISQEGYIAVESLFTGPDREHNIGTETLLVKASPELYTELFNMLHHQKHIFTDQDKLPDNDYGALRVFYATVRMEDQVYWIADYDEEYNAPNDQPVRHVKARRLDLVKKFAKILESGVYGTVNTQNPHFNHKEIRILPPPPSVLYRLAKRFPYNVDLLGVPKTYEVRVQCKRGRKVDSFYIALHHNYGAPMDKVIELLNFIETQLDPVATGKPTVHSFDKITPVLKPSKISVEVKTLSAFKTVQFVSREAAKRILSFLETHHHESAPSEDRKSNYN